jgi:hypothetical protein
MRHPHRDTDTETNTDETVFEKLKPTQKAILKAVRLEAETKYSYVAYEQIMDHAVDKISFRRQIGRLVMNDFLNTTGQEIENNKNASYYLTDKGLEAVKEIM